jgi:hypothetical protein
MAQSIHNQPTNWATGIWGYIAFQRAVLFTVFFSYLGEVGRRILLVVKALGYKPEGRGFETR